MQMQNVLAPCQSRAGLSYNLSMAMGAMLATLAVVVYADCASTLAAERVHVILEGMQIILLTVAAGVIAGGLHVLSTAGEPAAPAPARRTATA